MKTVTIPKKEYDDLKRKASLDEDLLKSLVRSLEDVRAGRLRPFSQLKP